MSIFVVGINHKTATLALREKAYFAQDQLMLYLQDLCQQTGVREAVILSTCNRSELYCDTDDIEMIKQWFFTQTLLQVDEFKHAVYVYCDQEAVSHMMAVASGLDSMIVGEPQILGQMKEAFSESCTAGAVGPLFHRLFQQIFTIAKSIRTTTSIGACPVSVASAAVHFAKQQWPELKKSKVLLIGAGDTASLLLRYLHPSFDYPITIINRDFEKAYHLAKQHGVYAAAFDQLSAKVSEVDIIFSATGSAHPLLTRAMMDEIMKHRSNRPLFCIDVAVPRDIDASVAEIENISLHCIDDLKIIIEQNRQGREHAAEKAREMIHKNSQTFMHDLSSFDKVTHMIRAYRAQIEALCYAELIKAKQQMHQGMDPLQVLDAFAHAFTKKLLHTPSVQLRKASVEDRLELLNVAKQLFALSDTENDIEHV